MEQGFMRKSIDQGCNKSPLDQGRIDVGFENIAVKKLWPPPIPEMEKAMRQVLAKQVISTTGHDPGKELPPELAEELFKGGLQTGLEVFSLVFEVSGISRQLTHELVRTRKGVFHQQSFRWTDLGDKFNVRMPQSIADNPIARKVYEDFVNHSREVYATLKGFDLPYQDCRNVCPIGTETYIICSYPISEFINTYAYRACQMMLPEYQHVIKRMREETLKDFPWMEPFIKVSCERTKRCTFQGWESTETCDMPWKSDRVYKPDYALLGLRGKAYGQ